MAGNMDTLKKGYEAFGRGDLDGATADFSDDIRWENPEAPQLPNHGVTEGKDGVKGLFADVTTNWETFELHPDEFIDGGETIVVLSHAHVKGSGGEAQLPFVHVWRFEDGKVVEVQALTDTAVAAQAAGNL